MFSLAVRSEMKGLIISLVVDCARLSDEAVWTGKPVTCALSRVTWRRALPCVTVA